MSEPQPLFKPLQDATPPEPRKCTVLTCSVSTLADAPAHVIVEVTLGYEDGAVEAVRLAERDARQLVERCAFALQPGGLPPRPYATRAWVNRFSVTRAEARLGHGEEFMANGVRRTLPQVWEYVEEHLQLMRRLLAQRGRNQPKPETLCRRIRTALLVVIDAVRVDT